MTPCRTRLLRVCHFRNVPTVVAGPSQNRACAIYAHGSSHGQFTENPSLLCDAISLSLVPRFCERPVSPHTTLPCVASFPPAALPAFAGTTAPSDSLGPVCLPPFIIGCRAYLLPCRRSQGLPGCHIFAISDMPCSQTPGKQLPTRHVAGNRLDFRYLKSVVLPDPSFRGSITSTIRLTAYRLAVLRLTSGVTPFGPRTRYPVSG